jgi:plastocyanin
MRRHINTTVALLALTGAGIFAGVFLQASSAQSTTHASTVKINVVAKEWSFTLSKRSVPVGTTVAFKVTNKGKIGHNFVIAGKKTKLLNPGQSQTISVKFAKKGKFKYLCSVSGHARLGMTGTFGVGVSGGGGGTTTTTATQTTTTTAGNVGSAQTTVQVNMVDYQFQLSQSTIPSGKVTFVIKNSGNDVHNFDLNGVKSGTILSPGQTETWTVSLAPGQYLYTCDVPFHVDRGMTGTIQITP